jgi:hypothetical protein
MVYISRYGAKFGDGDKIKWEIGEKARLMSQHGREPAAVTIASGFVTNAATSDRCIEVTFDGENDAKYCVSAKMLVPVGGFPPFA